MNYKEFDYKTLTNFAIAPRDFNYVSNFLSAEAVRIHYEGHHVQYNNKLIKLLEEKPLLLREFTEENNNIHPIYLDQLMKNGNAVRKIVKYSFEANEIDIYCNAAQIWNHNLFWLSLKENNIVAEDLESFVKTKYPVSYNKIIQDYGIFLQFIQQIVTAPDKLFGSIWIWIALDKITNKLQIKLTKDAGTLACCDYLIPLLTIDVWEHAYYVVWFNKKQEFLSKVPLYLNWELLEIQLKSLVKNPHSASSS